MDSNGFASAGQAGPYQFVADAAQAYLASGRSIGGPIPPNSKFPEGNGWKIYQKRLPTRQKIASWFDGRFLQGLCIICGKVSGGLEVLDFDEMLIYQTFVHLVSELGYDELLQRLVIEHTPKPGVHLGYLCEVIEGNRKLAREQIGTLPNGKPDMKTLIETRGEGGLIVAAPTPPGIHPDHRERGYELIQGDWTRPPQITPEEREILWNCARALNRYVRQEASYGAPKDDTSRVGSEYNERISQKEIRERPSKSWG